MEKNIFEEQKILVLLSSVLSWVLPGAAFRPSLLCIITLKTSVSKMQGKILPLVNLYDTIKHVLQGTKNLAHSGDRLFHDKPLP